MKETKDRYPQISGSTKIVLNGRDISVRFEGRTITVGGRDDDLKSVLAFAPTKLKSFNSARRTARLLSRFGFTLRLEDSKGVVLSVGKGVWTPLGRFSFRPRLRRYIGDRNQKD